MGLNVDDVRLAGRGLRLQRKPFEAQVSEPGDLEVFVSEGSLADFLNRLAPAGLTNFSIDARDGKLHVRATKVVLLPIPATAVCTLRVVNQQQLFVDLESVEVAGGASIKTLIQSQLDRINPLVDAADLPLQAKIDRVTVENGGVVLRGTVSP